MNAGHPERLGELLMKLRLFKVRERLEALLQEAAASELNRPGIPGDSIS